MLRVLKNVVAVGVLGLSVQAASAFSLLGEFDAWQVEALTYGFGEIGGPKNLGNEYRLNTPVITYGYHPSFLDYFGRDGVRAVDEAIRILNRLPRVSRTRADLSEFLLDSIRVNHRAQALQLLDLKSETLAYLVEHRGLAGENWVFGLRHRVLPGGASCPNYIYTVIMRNFDPVSWVPTAYVNGNLYTYQILELCPTPNRADAIELLVDPTSSFFTAVASWKERGSMFGEFFLGLTRDDMGGLRYLYRRNNFNNEPLPTNSFSFSTQFSSPWNPVVISTNVVQTNAVATRAGIEKVVYRKVRYDSHLGRLFRPLQHRYSLLVLEDFKLRKEPVRRIILEPDIIFAASDISTPPTTTPLINPHSSRRANIWITVTNSVTIPANNLGPGTIDPQTTITFNKIGPFFQNSSPFFLNEDTATPGFIWASFNGSTNPPIIFPFNTTIEDIERQALIGP